MKESEKLKLILCQNQLLMAISNVVGFTSVGSDPTVIPAILSMIGAADSLSNANQRLIESIKELEEAESLDAPRRWL